ncbi:hypothetical protein L208DRAFT_1327554 [Tricholoma matsutake]|nr:hypothetical protein L208DRAFT_1327554 [Tricholoma matsutake 945]
MVKPKDASQCHYKWGHLCTTYKAILEWDKRSGLGWNDSYGANARTPSEKQVFEEFLKTPKHAPLRSFMMRAWPHYRKMPGFMPGVQPHGTHAFDPSSHSVTEMLNAVNAEEDGAEDQVTPLDSPMSNMPAVATAPSPLVNPDLGTYSSGGTSSVVSSFPPPNLSASSSSGGTGPLPSSSLPPSVHLQQSDTSMGSVHSITTGSEAGQKCKQDARSLSGMQPPSSKRSSRSKTNDLNPVIISSALNSTLNHMADVMERSLNVTAATITHTAPTTPSAAPPSIITSPVERQTTQLLLIPSQPLGSLSNPSSASASLTEILDQVIRIISADASFLLDNELLAASLFFTSASEDAVHAACTFIALGSNQAVQHHFLLHQLEIAALLPGKGKGKAVEDDDHIMSTQSSRNASLKGKGIMRREKENPEVLLEHSKNTLDNIACLSMTKVE